MRQTSTPIIHVPAFSRASHVPQGAVSQGVHQLTAQLQRPWSIHASKTHSVYAVVESDGSFIHLNAMQDGISMLTNLETLEIVGARSLRLEGGIGKLSKLKSLELNSCE